MAGLRDADTEADGFPFDRAHVHVDVSFPLARISRRADLFAEVGRRARMFGGAPAMASEPAPGFAGLPGYETFGMSVAFEAGDANVHGFLQSVAAAMARDGVTVSHDPSGVVHPSEDDAPGIPGQRT